MKGRWLIVPIASVLVVVAVVCDHAASAQDGTASAAPASFIKQPYLQDVTDTSAQVRWEAAAAEPGRVEFGPSPDRLDRTAEAVLAPVEVLVPDENDSPIRQTVTLQQARLSGLTPGTVWAYRVRQGQAVSETFQFITADPKSTRFRFVVYGDTRTYPEDHRKVAAAIRRARPAFAVHTGDLVALGDQWPLWDTEFFGPLHPLTAEVPMWVARGNHEQSGRFLPFLFHLPGPEKEFYYRFDYGRARFIVLDYAASRPKMFAWMEYQLNAPPQPTWKFIFVHYPPFSVVSRRSYGPGWERERLAWLCQRYGVDLVFAGHDHDYMRTEPILAYRASPGEPTTFIVTAGGGAPLYTPSRASYQAVAKAVHHFCAVDIDDRKLTMSAIDANNDQVFDRLVLEKDTAGRIVTPADYRGRALDVEYVNAIESLRRDLTAWNLTYLEAGEVVPLEREVVNPFPGPVSVTVSLVGGTNKWLPFAPRNLTLAPRVPTPVRMSLTARRALEDLIDAGRFRVEYVLPDGRTGTLMGEGIRVASRPEAEAITRPQESDQP